MKTNSYVRDLDYVALGSMIGLSVLFVNASAGLTSLLMVSVIVMLGGISWIFLRMGRDFSFKYRVALSLLLFGMLAFFKSIPSGQVGAMVLFFSLYVVFSTEQSRVGASLRATCGILSVIALTVLMAPSMAFPFAIVFSFLFVGSLISAWSGMGLKASIFWFAKRSIRKETVFLIIFLAGISAIGLRQAQNYAGRQSELSGLSRILSPGSMTNLMLSPAVAMRVKFAGKFEFAPSNGYFRGAVMDRFIGFNWMPGLSRIRGKVSPNSTDISYQVAISPRYNDFVPVLDYGVSVKSDDHLQVQYSARDNGVFQTLKISDSWSYYTATSRDVPVHELSLDDWSNLLQVPRNLEPSIIALAKKIRSSGSVSDFMQSFANYLTQNKFQYTLSPGQGSLTLNDFLFKGRKGACEHYAAAAASLARISGIPARVVAGFLGGSWDPTSLTLYVRDLDAHAWVELWSSDLKRWIRFDPVIYVAPERIISGAEVYLRSIGANIPDENAMQEKLLYASLFMELDNLIAMLNGGFVSSVAGSIIDYGEELALVGAFGLLLSFIVLRLRRFYAERKSPEAKQLSALKNVLSPLGVEKKAGEPLDTWALRFGGEYDEIKPELMLFAEVYGRYCYSGRAVKSDLKLMQQVVASLKLKVKLSKIVRHVPEA